MDVTRLLVGDHYRVKGLFARFTEAQESENLEEATELAAKIVKELTIHTTIEEEVFYPAVHKMSEELAHAVDEGIQEHHVVNVLLEELPRAWSRGVTSGSPR